MHQLAAYLQDLGAQYFPDLREAQYAEFWAHSRRHSSGEGGGFATPLATGGLAVSQAPHDWSLLGAHCLTGRVAHRQLELDHSHS
jgi:hypothetical protein